MARPAAVIDSQRVQHVEELFFTATDRKGIIRSGNAVFDRISGYTQSEYIGAPHNIVRHPDTPRVVFRILWQALEAGRPVAAYVKNRSKDGAYYWVLALAYPAGNEYLSIRLLPTSEFFTGVQSLYATLHQIEEIEEELNGRTAGMDLAEQRLNEALVQLGFADYEHFMWHALALEVAARRATLAKTEPTRMAPTSDPYLSAVREDGTASGASILDTCRTAAGHLSTLSERLDDYDVLAGSLSSATKCFTDLAEDVASFGLNAVLAADRTRASSGVLHAIASLMQRTAQSLRADISQLEERLHVATECLRHLAFTVSASALAVEMLTNFLSDGEARADEHRTRLDTAALLTSLVRDLPLADLALQQLQLLLPLLSQGLQALASRIGELGILRLRAQIEAASDESASQFLNAIAHIDGQLTTASERIMSVRRALTAAGSHAAQFDGAILEVDTRDLTSILKLLG